MNTKKCDYCKIIIRNQCGIHVKGMAPDAGIALPPSCYEHDFCKVECILDWIILNKPKAFMDF